MRRGTDALGHWGTGPLAREQRRAVVPSPIPALEAGGSMGRTLLSQAHTLRADQPAGRRFRCTLARGGGS